MLPDNVVVRVIICDLGGTLTRRHGAIDDSEFIPIFQELIDRGVKIGGITARNREYAIGPLGIADPELLGCFSFVSTGGGGAIWRPPWEWFQPMGPRYPEEVVGHLRRLGVPNADIWPDWASIGTWSRHEPLCRRVIDLVERHREHRQLRRAKLQVVPDDTSILLLPEDLDKEVVATSVMASEGIDMKNVLVCANGRNDVRFAAAAALAMVPADAHSSLRELPNALVASQPGPAGIKSLLTHLLADRIPGCSVGRGPGVALA
jgi:hydroxymethylpyrimidine pyrophosphatase-like HAD family hydrolase